MPQENSTALTTPRVSLSPATKDWRQLRDELFARAPGETDGKWTDLNPSDPGVVILEMLIGQIEMVLWYLDNQATEVTFEFTRQRKNLANLLKLIDYEIRGFSSSGGAVTFNLAPGAGSPVFPIPVPKGTVVSGTSESGADVLYFTQETVQLAAPSQISGTNLVSPSAATIDVVQGVELPSSEVFVSDGTGNQRFVLRAEQVSKELITVRVGTSQAASTEWDAVSNIIVFESGDEIFVPFIGADGQAFVQFGDGKFGKIPPLGQSIFVTVVTTGGSAGNLAANTVTRVISDITDAVGNSVSLNVTNSLAMTGGTDPETIEDAKRRGPALFAALFRAMAKTDYIALMDSIPGVIKANAWGEQEEEHPEIKLINRVMLAFLSEDDIGLVDPESELYDSRVDDLKLAIFTLLEERKPITTRLVFKKPEWVDLLIDVTVAVDRTQFDPVIVAGDVQLALQNEFAFTAVQFGLDARISQINTIIQGVAGVSWATIRIGSATVTVVGTVRTVVFNNPDTTPGAPATVTDPSDAVGVFDVKVSRWQLLRVEDYNAAGTPVLGTDTDNLTIPHITIRTTTQVDEPFPDPLPDPCVE